MRTLSELRVPWLSLSALGARRAAPRRAEGATWKCLVAGGVGCERLAARARLRDATRWAQAEAERRMPDFNTRVGALVARLGLAGESFVQRITGCPNGCARPYMAELAFVGQAHGARRPPRGEVRGGNPRGG